MSIRKFNMSNNLAEYQAFEATTKMLLLLSGLWPGCTWGIQYRLLILFNRLIAIFVDFAILRFAYNHVTNRDDFMKAIAIGLAFLTVFLKTICFIGYGKRLRDLHESLSATFTRDFNNEELRPILLSRLPWFSRRSTIVTCATWAAIAVYWFTPIISIAVQKFQGLEVIKYILPYSATYPWQIDPHSWRYPAHYILDVYAGIVLALNATSTDALFGYYTFQISGQLKTLSHRIRNISSSNDYKQVVRDCLRRHQILVKCLDHISRIYGPIVLWLLSTNALIICALIYQASRMSFRKAVFVSVYIIMKLMQTLVYGSFGTNLAVESENFRDAVYSSGWAGTGEKRLMSYVLIMLMYKPFVLNACGMAEITVNMFINVCNTAMSYFFMLRTLDEASEL